jgi:hypothetical protein
MPPECWRTLTQHFLHPFRLCSPRPASSPPLPNPTVRCLRLLVSALIAVAIAVPPLPYMAAGGTRSPCQACNHLPRKQPRNPTVAKTRVTVAVSGRLSLRDAPEARPHAAKRLPSPSCPCLSVQSPRSATFGRVFRPLRC